jgi:hypothetical protein
VQEQFELWTCSECICTFSKKAKEQYHREGQSMPTFPSVSTTSLLTSKIVRCLIYNYPTRSSLTCLKSFMDLIPASHGINNALDSVVQCICTSYSNMLTQNDGLCKSDIKQHSVALRCVRKSLCDGREALSSEALCSVVLLSWYEVWCPWLAIPKPKQIRSWLLYEDIL